MTTKKAKKKAGTRRDPRFNVTKTALLGALCEGQARVVHLVGLFENRANVAPEEFERAYKELARWALDAEDPNEQQRLVRVAAAAFRNRVYRELTAPAQSAIDDARQALGHVSERLYTGERQH